jgi:hypothetical protein
MNKSLTASTLATVLVAAAACAAARTPSETYLDYHGATLQAKAIEDLVRFMPQAARDKMASAPAEAKDSMFRMRQEMEKIVVGQPKVVKEDVQGENATLDVEAVIDYTRTNPNLGQKPAQAKIKLLKERDGWKVVNAPNWAMK